MLKTCATPGCENIVHPDRYRRGERRCWACRQENDRHLQERDELADRQAAGHNINATQHLCDALAYGLGVASISKEGVEHHPLFEVMKMPDPAAHYRHVIRAPITDEDIARGYTEVKLDPYRVCDVYQTGGGPREQMIKKLLRWTDKGQSEGKVIAEIESALKRWKEMREEDAACRGQ